MRSKGRAFAGSATLALCLGALGGTAAAEVLWRGDFETGLTGWNRTLNGGGISIVNDPVVQGSKAARVVITSSDLWSNGLNRVELNYGPPKARTAEGAQMFFGWHFYMPKAFGTDGHQIGYWETGGPYKQLMSFSVKGTTLDFATRLPTNKRHFTATVAPGQWHQIVMQIKWAQQGWVSVWLDGKQLLDKAAAQTTYMGAAAFIQVGILRGTASAPPETIFIDRALEATTLEEILTTSASPPPAPTPDAGAAMDATARPDVRVATSDAQSTPAPMLPEPPATTSEPMEPVTPSPIVKRDASLSPGPAPTFAPDPDPLRGAPVGGCSLSASPGGAAWGWLPLVAFLALVRRRRSP